MALYTVSANGKVKAQDLNQIIQALNGAVGVPMRFDAVSDGGQYAVTIRNQGPGGLALLVRDATGATLFQVSGSSVRAAIAGTLQDLVGISAAQTLSGKTLASPQINNPSIGGVMQLTNAILRQAQQTIASAATLTLPDTGNVFEVTGNTNITKIDIKPAGTTISLRFLGALTLVHDTVAPENLDLGGQNITVVAGQVVDLLSDGILWHVKQRTGGSAIASGTYNGDGVAKTIALPWTPVAVLIYDLSTHALHVALTNAESLYIPQGFSGNAANTAMKITTNGFTIGTDTPGANGGGSFFAWVAARQI